MANSTNFQLELVQVLFRHGARTYSEQEAAMVPNRYLDTSLHETYGYEQLTTIGKMQAHKLGYSLREHYSDFLGALYHPRDVYAYSSNITRTKMTLLLVLAGLFPPPTEQIWNENLQWTPIPFSFVPSDIDILLKLYNQPIYSNKLDPVINSIETIKDRWKLPEVSGFLEKQGFNFLNKNLVNECFGIYNVLSSHKAANAKLPVWYSDELLRALREYVVFHLDLMSSTVELRKLISGPLVKRFLENMNINSSTINPKKILLYSGHEINLAAFVRAHNVQNFVYPDFASAVIVEKLRDSQNQLYIRMLGYTGKDDKFIILNLRDCVEFCPIGNYLKIVEDIMPSDEEFNLILNHLNTEFRKKKSRNMDFGLKPECEHDNLLENLF